MLIADYILYTLNRKKAWDRYVRWMGLEGPCDCITTVLMKGCIHLNLMNVLKDIAESGG